MHNVSDWEDMILPGGIIIQNTFYPKKLFYSATLRIILTTDCNFKCVYCYAEGEKNKIHRLLKVNDVIAVLNVAKKIGVRNIKLTGGEPLCYPELEELLDYLMKSGFVYDITTNASLLSPQCIDLLNQYHVSAVNISLDSLDSTRYTSLTGYKDFNKIVLNIRNAISLFHGRVRINCIVFDDTNNLHDYEHIIRFCIDNAIDIRLIEPTSVTNQPITCQKTNFHKLLSTLRNTASRVVLSDCGTVDYFFMEDACITALHSLCDNCLCGICEKYMYMRLTSELKLKPCLIREDTEIAIDVSSEETIMAAFLSAVEKWIHFSEYH